jgi:hypothetical protein
VYSVVAGLLRFSFAENIQKHIFTFKLIKTNNKHVATLLPAVFDKNVLFIEFVSSCNLTFN